MENKKKEKIIITGIAVSDAKDKTAVIVVERTRNSRIYHKKYFVTKKYKVHDPENKIKLGNLVRITQSRPISKRKSFVIVENI